MTGREATVHLCPDCGVRLTAGDACGQCLLTRPGRKATPCGAVTEVPSAVPVEQGVVQRTGYPDDCLTQCCRLAGHDGPHFTVLPLASAPGTFSWSWEDNDA